MLVSDENEKMALQAKMRGNDLRFGYYYAPSSEKLRSSDVGWLVSLGFLVWSMVLLSIIVIFHELLGLLGMMFLGLMIIIPLGIIVGRHGRPSVSYYKDTRRKQKEIDQLVIEIGKSMDATQLTPFKGTTIELED
jgi:hypothetical protein